MDAIDLLKKADELAENRRKDNPILYGMGRKHFSETEIDIICEIARQIQEEADEIIWIPVNEKDLLSFTKGEKMSIVEMDALMKRGGFYGARKTKEGFEYGLTKRRLWELQQAGLGTVKIEKPE